MILYQFSAMHSNEEELFGQICSSVVSMYELYITSSPGHIIVRDVIKLKTN